MITTSSKSQNPTSLLGKVAAVIENHDAANQLDNSLTAIGLGANAAYLKGKLNEPEFLRHRQSITGLEFLASGEPYYKLGIKAENMGRTLGALTSPNRWFHKVETCELVLTKTGIRALITYEGPPTLPTLKCITTGYDPFTDDVILSKLTEPILRGFVRSGCTPECVQQRIRERFQEVADREIRS